VILVLIFQILIKFVKDLPMIDAQFRFNRCNSFRKEYISVFSPYGPVLINTMTCGGSHLGFPIGIENREPSDETTTAGHSFYIGPIGSFYIEVNDTGS
jgi:hypothetical protein